MRAGEPNSANLRFNGAVVDEDFGVGGYNMTYVFLASAARKSSRGVTIPYFNRPEDAAASAVFRAATEAGEPALLSEASRPATAAQNRGFGGEAGRRSETAQ